MKKRRGWIHFLMILIFGLALGLAGCEGDDGEQGPPGPPGPPGLPVEDGETTGSILLDWQQSGHADTEGEALRHWDEDGEIPTSCARCHSAEGFVSFVQDGEIEEAADTEGAISCGACHASTIYDSASGEFDMSAAGAQLEPVTFPSGATATLNGPSNMCMVCHQGRAAGQQVGDTVPAGASIVQNAIDAAPEGPFNFINIHYYAASASLFGAEVNGGYQYPGNTYVGQFTHVPTRNTCVECHMGPVPAEGHTFNPRPEYCTDCHEEVDPNAEEPFRDIRLTSTTDFDGDGDVQEGLYGEIQTLEEALLTAIQDYAANTIGTPIVFENNYPYFMADTNGDGVGDGRYEQFDATLLGAAYNYQVSHAEPCGYIHNARYIMQLLYDSIEAVGGDVSSFNRPSDVGATGIVSEWLQSGHADETGEAFNHWNAELEVPTRCAKCHTQQGFRDFAQDGEVSEAVPVTVAEGAENAGLDDTLACGTCHIAQGEIAATTDPTTLWGSTDFQALEPVTFPSGAEETLEGPSNMCMSCHQGRASGVTVEENITANDFGFVNRHYYAAGAILFGTEVTAGYEYDGRTYAGQNMYIAHPEDLSTCVGCHMRQGEAFHGFTPDITVCDNCHTGIETFEDIGMNVGRDYDGDGTVEGFQAEIDAFGAELLALINSYPATQDPALTPILYVPEEHPYFFADADQDGLPDPDTSAEAEPGEGLAYPDFDAPLLRAAYNYHSAQDPCGDMHNVQYVIQTLYDSIDALDDGTLNMSVQINGNDAVRPEAAGGENGGTTPAPDTVVLVNEQGDILLNHANHTTFATCSQCHPSSPPGAFADTLNQTSGHNICLDCHVANNAPTACSACHGTAPAQ